MDVYIRIGHHPTSKIAWIGWDKHGKLPAKKVHVNDVVIESRLISCYHAFGGSPGQS